jgi:nucleoside 2-deoxyribosyltransferase/DNA-directed RNA polymerase subunit RPC12/RpoP
MDSQKCLICGLSSNDVKINNDDIKCPRCGRYLVVVKTHRANPALPNPKLSAWIRERNERGEDITAIGEDEILQSLPNYSVSEKQLILLQNIERKSKHPGDYVSLNWNFDCPLAWAESEWEFRFYVDSLEQRNLLKPSDYPSRGDGRIRRSVSITSQGFDFLEKNRRNFEEKTQCFVAMSFDKEMDSVWLNAIKPAIEKAGYRPYRIDKELHMDRIDAKIIAEIKNSRFLVADVTSQKKGVYFEAGFALGLGLPVLWSVREADLKNVHFDTRQYNHIVWKDETDLHEQLYDFICAIIGKKTGTAVE